MNDFNQDDETVARRKKLADDQIKLSANEQEYLNRLARFTKLEEDLWNLRKANVVVNGLAWDIGYPIDGTGPLSRYLDGVLFASRGGNESKGPAYWFQMAGDTRGQSWNGSLVDSDGNGTYEFAEPAMPLPLDRWTRELNFLGWVPAEGGNRVADLPAGAKIRVALQWTETHNPQADYVNGTDPYRTPLVDLKLLVLRQRDPSGKQVASDDFNVIARSTKLPQMIERTANLATYESVIEFTVESAGRYAVRLEGFVPPTTWPAEVPFIPTQVRQWEPRARVFVEASGAMNGRPVIADFPSQFGGLGTPGDAIVPRTVGAANSRGGVQPYSAAGPKRRPRSAREADLHRLRRIAAPGRRVERRHEYLSGFRGRTGGQHDQRRRAGRAGTQLAVHSAGGTARRSRSVARSIIAAQAVAATVTICFAATRVFEGSAPLEDSGRGDTLTQSLRK